MKGIYCQSHIFSWQAEHYPVTFLLNIQNLCTVFHPLPKYAILDNRGPYALMLTLAGVRSISSSGSIQYRIVLKTFQYFPK